MTTRLTNRLSLDDVKQIALNAAFAKNNPAWKDLAVNIEILAKQLLSTMQENETLKYENEQLRKTLMPIATAILADLSNDEVSDA